MRVQGRKIHAVYEQIAVSVLGVLCVYLSQHSKDSVRRSACVLGVLSQPLWFHISWQSGQYGVFALCVVYMAVWLQAFYKHWIKPLNIFRSTNGNGS